MAKGLLKDPIRCKWALVNTANDRRFRKFHDCVVISIAIKSTPDQLFNCLTDIENRSEFFPQVEFRLVTEGPLEVGSIYHTRQKGAKNWSPYRVLAIEADALMSAELVGKDPLFFALRYEHRFIVEGSSTISHEKIEYTFKFGVFGRFLNFILARNHGVSVYSR